MTETTADPYASGSVRVSRVTQTFMTRLPVKIPVLDFDGEEERQSAGEVRPARTEQERSPRRRG